MNALVMQVRREIWEHRTLWIAPLVAAGLVMVGSLFGDMNFQMRRPPTEPDGPPMVFATAVAVTGFLTVVGSLVIFAYLLDCLYAERKDRSILFWKSMPVSDAVTVLTKFAVAVVVAPLAIWVLGMVTHLLSTGVLAIRQPEIRDALGDGLIGVWLGAQGRLLMGYVVAALWYAPIASYLMLASAYARRAPLMVALLPLVVPTLGERIIFGTSYIWSFLVDRLFAWNVRGFPTFNAGGELLAPLAEPALWLGLAAAAGMMYIVIRMRRYRDDT
jgi:ABC-2 type transport system permease protein